MGDVGEAIDVGDRFGPYFIEPVIAGLDKENKPYLFSSDFIGAPLLPDMDTNGFVVAGTCTEQLMGMCESMWRKGEAMSP